MSTDRKLNIICWSGGKDSTATIVLAHELGIPIDLIVISLLWFDKKRRIYAEYPEAIEWIFNHAIPLFESWGYKVKVIESDRDYVHWFYHIIERTEHEDRKGKLSGWLIGGMCAMNREKINPVKRYLKTLGKDYQEYIGIAADEPERLERVHRKGQISLLEKKGIIEEQTYDILRPYNLISPTYKFSTRGGCWFCPNQKIKEFAYLKTNHPELWAELVTFDSVPNKVSEGFKYGQTFKEISDKVDAYIANPPPVQLSLFDYLYEEV